MLGKEISTRKINCGIGIGCILRDVRISMVYTLSQVSELTGIAEETIRRAELDKFEPKISTLEILSDFYRLDLIELIARKRNYNSIFSDAMISKVNDIINKSDLNHLKQYAENLLLEYDDVSGNLKTAYTTFLYALKYIKYNPINGQSDTISNLENILLDISPNFLNKTKLTYPFPLEMNFIILLAITYRQNSDYNKTIELLQTSINRIQNMPLINNRFSDYLASCYLNLAYTYHSMGENNSVVSTVDKCLNNDKVNYTRIVLSHLLFRKGLALYLLNEPNGKYLLSTSISLMDSNVQIQMNTVLREKYDLDLSYPI
jgi:transcriptional regulator with XRE-family HTH domain